MVKKPGKRDFPNPAVVAAETDVAGLRSLSMEERGQLLMSACAAAAMIAWGRRESGLPPSSPAPWPRSTQQFMRKWASDVRSAAQRD